MVALKNSGLICRRHVADNLHTFVAYFYTQFKAGGEAHALGCLAGCLDGDVLALLLHGDGQVVVAIGDHLLERGVGGGHHALTTGGLHALDTTQEAHGGSGGDAADDDFARFGNVAWVAGDGDRAIGDTDDLTLAGTVVTIDVNDSRGCVSVKDD